MKLHVIYGELVELFVLSADFGRFERSQSLDRGVSVVGAVLATGEKFGSHFFESGQLQNRADRTAGENTFAVSRSDFDPRSGVFGLDLVRNRHILGRIDGNHVLLGIAESLLDGKRSVARLALTDAHLALPVAGHQSDREVETAAAGHNTGNAPQGNYFLVEFGLDPGI